MDTNLFNIMHNNIKNTVLLVGNAERDVVLNGSKKTTLVIVTGKSYINKKGRQNF